ncbi:monothiol glutaredoxin [Leishmania donovani]|uniref:Monothiol_glutaredoxin_-_putative n=3 Tax=Leishmania donovani species complex TaxID=38574 RepID=A0A6L0WS88_LEIIN|nr:glutaredoxin-like protein [Leishmania infantum JPCM5]XP_003858219.1 glutaredoxin-like protein [Leishmania donovani]CAC9443079.1 monothiol_glutaredoxin_-_putative [Leishmania infantum]AYU75937.1 monothiol glutaredoxin, putative [Leishmania donovani]TPP44042.1 Glutaredoxin family protein [Leishmania donovani]TPP51869.1 Glutaredoxin family protein [Leishmania donovani]CAJ1986003.1 monothiol glutaredoxin [Leishmania donovani]|eukprot:XP_001462992.1 glutaredoxin-like protein [Leishmania infantum JPCM5]
MRSLSRGLSLAASGRLVCVSRRSSVTASTALAATYASANAVPCSSLSSSMAASAHRASAAFFHTSRVHRAPSDVSDDLAKDLHDIICHDRLVVFLTGTPSQPRCRFTAQLVDLLDQLGVKYSFFNIMDDEEVCEGLKAYSDWPTYPQVYVDGELLGGFDICKTMMLDGTLTTMLKDKQLI